MDHHGMGAARPIAMVGANPRGQGLEIGARRDA
jgi:hypothetical protein